MLPRHTRLLLDLEQAQIAFGLVVLERDRQVVEEGEHLVLAEPEALQEILGWGLLHAPALSRPARRRWIGGMPGGQQLAVASDERLAGLRGEARAALGPRCFDGGLRLPQQRLERLGPDRGSAEIRVKRCHSTQGISANSSSRQEGV